MPGMTSVTCLCEGMVRSGPSSQLVYMPHVSSDQKHKRYQGTKRIRHAILPQSHHHTSTIIPALSKVEVYQRHTRIRTP